MRTAAYPPTTSPPPTSPGAAYQDVEAAEAAGYVSTLDSLGCFHDPERGGMGLHYLDESELDGTVDVAAPEALVYELDRNGEVVGLVAHEYNPRVRLCPEGVPLFGVDLPE